MGDSGLVENAHSGDRIATLKSLRDVLAKSINDCESMRDISSLSNQLRATLDEIERLEPPTVIAGDPVDEITARRAARQSGTAKATNRAKRSG